DADAIARPPYEVRRALSMPCATATPRAVLVRPRPRSPFFPYTTLFRSTTAPRASRTAPAARSCRCTGWPGPPRSATARAAACPRSEEHTSELQSRENLVCRLLLEKKKTFHDTRKPSYFHIIPPLVDSVQ